MTTFHRQFYNGLKTLRSSQVSLCPSLYRCFLFVAYSKRKETTFIRKATGENALVVKKRFLGTEWQHFTVSFTMDSQLRVCPKFSYPLTKLIFTRRRHVFCLLLHIRRKETTFVRKVTGGKRVSREKRFLGTEWQLQPYVLPWTQHLALVPIFPILCPSLSQRGDVRFSVCC